MKQQYKSFMGQFDAAQREVAELRRLMQDSARLATLSFPKAIEVRTTVASERSPQVSKKRT